MTMNNETNTNLSCEGCVYRYWMQAAPRMFSTSSSGWACELTGGRAMNRCKSYIEGDEPLDDHYYHDNPNY